MTSTARPTGAHAATVSRILTAAGLVTSHSDRRFRFEGIFVTKGAPGAVTVHLDLSTRSHRRTCAERIVGALEAKGYAVERDATDERLTVTRPAPQVEQPVVEAPAAVEALALVRVVTSGRARLAHLAYGVHSATLCGRPTAGWSAESGAELPLCAVCSEHASAADEPEHLFAVGDRVTDAPHDHTGDVVRVGGPDETGELFAAVIWDGSDGIPRQYAEGYLEHLDPADDPRGQAAVDNEVLDDAEDRDAAQVREFVRQQARGLGIDPTVEQAQQRARGGHPGPARRTTSVRFTDEQYRRLDAAAEAGYGAGLNAVLARLVDEHLTPDGTARGRAADIIAELGGLTPTDADHVAGALVGAKLVADGL